MSERRRVNPQAMAKDMAGYNYYGYGQLWPCLII